MCFLKKKKPGNMCVNSSHLVKPLPDPFLAPSTYNSEHIKNDKINLSML